MKMVKIGLTVFLFLFFAALSHAMEIGNAENGAKLFADPQFAGSTNAKSCSSCHKEGDLQQAGSRKNLVDTINNCIASPLAGKPLGIDSQEMMDMQAYIKSLAK